MKYAMPVTLVTLTSLAAAYAVARQPAAPNTRVSATVVGAPPWLSGALPEPVATGHDHRHEVHEGDPHTGLFGAGNAVAAHAAAPGEACSRDTDSASHSASNADFSAAPDPHAHARVSTPGVEVPSSVPRSTATNGRSIVEIFTEREALRDQLVTVRGSVVKRTDGVLGKSYVHLRDGSGLAAQGNDDLTLTTNDELQLGELVEVQGQVWIDHDLGIGYRYPVLLAAATRVAAPTEGR
jgi:hypothetical protein